MSTDVKFRLAMEGGQIVSQTIDGVTRRLDTMGSAAGAAKNLLAGMAAGLSVGAFAAYTKATIDAADALNDLSQRVGISVAALGKYQLAAEQSGTSLEAVAKGIKGMAANLLEHGDALKKAGITATTADAAMQQLADVFAAMPDGMEKTTLATKLFGKAGMDLIPMLNLGSDGLRAAAAESSAYAEQMAILAPLADAFNDNLATLAMGAKTLGATLINQVMPSLVQISDALTNADGSASAFARTFGSAVNITLQTVAVLASEVAFVFKGIGREIGGIVAQFSAMGEAGGVFTAAGRAAWVAVGDAIKEDAAAARLELDRWQERLLAGAQNVQAAYNKRQGFGEQLKDTASGMAILAAMTDKATDAAKKLAAAQEKAIEDATRAAQLLANARNKEADDIEEYMRAESNRLADTARASEQAVRAAQDEYDNHGKLKSAIAETTLARLQDQLTTKTAGTEAYESLQRQITAQQQLIGILKNGEARDSAEDAAKALADANRKAAEDSGKYWEDALMRAFESGKGFFESLWSTIKNTLKTQVLRVMVTGVVGGMTGAANAMSGDSGGGGSLFGTVSGVKNTYDLFTGMGGYGGSFASMANDGLQLFSGYAQDAGFKGFADSLQGLSGSVLEYADVIDTAASGIGYLSAISSAANGEWGKAAGQAIGTYIFPVIGTLIGGVIGGFIDDIAGGGGGPKTEYGYGYGITGKHIAGDSTTPAAVYAKGIEDSWAALATKLGLASSLNVGAFTSQDPIGDAQTQVQVVAGINGSTVYNRADRLGGLGNIGNVGRTPEELATALQEETVRALFAALKASDLQGEYIAYLSTVGDSVAEMTAALDTVVLIKEFTSAMDALPFESLRDLSFEAAKGLLQASGGLQAFAANLSGFYENFYSDTEKTANLTRNLTVSFAALGQTMPAANADLKDWYRGQVEAAMALDQSVPANAQALAGLLALQGGVAQLATSAASAAATIAAAAEKAAQAAAQLQADITSAQDSAMSAYISAQNDYNAILQQQADDTAAAMTQAAQASAQAATAIRDALASAGQGIDALIRSLTTTAGGTLDPMALARSTQRAYLADLAGARGGDVDASGRIAASARAYLDASAAVSGTQRQGALTAQIVSELGALPAVKTYQDKLLEAVQGTTSTVATSSASNASTIAQALSTKLTAQLTVDATSTILKLINFVANTDALSPEAKQLALQAASTTERTISLLSNNSMLTDAEKQLVLSATSSTLRTITAALGDSDPVALGIAFAQNATIEKLIKASGGDLTPEQLLLINGIETYNKNIALKVEIDSASLTNAQQLMQSVFGTYNIGEILKSATGSTTLNEILGADQAGRLWRVLDYRDAWVSKATMQNGGWNDAASRAVAFGIYGEAPLTGITQLELANATGQSLQSMYDFFDAYGIPRFDVGTNFLPRDMLAQVHAGERIVPAADNRELMARLQSPQANNDALVAEIRALRQEVANLRRENSAENRAIASHTANTAASTRTLERDGVQVWTDPAEPIKTEAVA